MPRIPIWRNATQLPATEAAAFPPPLGISIDTAVSAALLILMTTIHINAVALGILWGVLFILAADLIRRLLHQNRRSVIVVIVVAGSVMFFLGQDAVSSRVGEDAAKEEAQKARMIIESVDFADIGGGDAPFPFFNFHYKNNGHLTAQGTRHRFGFRSIDNRPLTASEIDDFFRHLESDPYVFENNNDVTEGDSAYFSEPNSPGEEQLRLQSAIPDVKKGTSFLYLFVDFKYKDQLVASNAIRISEYCIFFL